MLARRHALRVAVGALAAGGLAAGLLAPHTTARQLAPALPGRVLDGRPLTIADLRGHPAALVFFASWCTGCRVEAAAVERFARSSPGRGRLVGIDYDDGGGWRAFLRRFGWSFPVLDDSSGAVGAAFGISNIPATVVLDSSGRIASISYGAQKAASLRTALLAAG